MSSNSTVGFFGGGGGGSNKNVSNSNIFASVNESRLRPEERLYHTILVKNISNINNSTITTTPTSLAYEYAEASESRRQELLTEALSSEVENAIDRTCLLYTSPSPRDRTRSRMPSSA